jgi:hypothetical protein
LGKPGRQHSWWLHQTVGTCSLLFLLLFHSQIYPPVLSPTNDIYPGEVTETLFLGYFYFWKEEDLRLIELHPSLLGSFFQEKVPQNVKELGDL